MELSEWREALAGVLGEHAWDTSDEQKIGGEWVWGLNCDCGEFVPGEETNTHLADAVLASPAMARLLAEVRAEALRVVRVVEGDMADQAAAAWRSADARRGLSDHEALIVHADALTRWSERFRMAMNGQDYRDDRTTAHPTDFTLTCEDIGCVDGRTIQGRKYHYDGSVEDQWAHCGRRADNCPAHPTDDHAGEAK